jgi:ADP-heptose:LPS heptosyltransferase
VRPLVKAIADRWYTALEPAADASAHELVRNWRFARRFDPETVLRTPELAPGMVRRPGWLPADRKYYVLFPGAAWSIKVWPAAWFGEIAARIHSRTGWRGIICGLLEDSAAAQELMQAAGDVPIIDACGKTSLAELAGAIAGASLTVTNDTSAAHLAAALRTPAIVILGGGHFGRFLPYPPAVGAAGASLRVAYREMPCYHCDWHCIYPRASDEPGPCVANVTIDDVWAQVEAALTAAPRS